MRKAAASAQLKTTFLPTAKPKNEFAVAQLNLKFNFTGGKFKSTKKRALAPGNGGGGRLLTNGLR
jgi:hypothetical protein